MTSKATMVAPRDEVATLRAGLGLALEHREAD